jgi:hypothetical protein
MDKIAELRQAILEGAIHRLRPKLLTEGAAILSIAPMLWATGVGAEVIRPMAAPVLGGLLIADEVIDVFLPVLYFAVQKRRWATVQHELLGPADRGRAPTAPHRGIMPEQRADGQRHLAPARAGRDAGGVSQPRPDSGAEFVGSGRQA